MFNIPTQYWKTFFETSEEETGRFVGYWGCESPQSDQIPDLLAIIHVDDLSVEYHSDFARQNSMAQQMLTAELMRLRNEQ